jgi:hypothetical protein
MTLANAKDVGQIVAWFSAAVFFLYKLISGYLIGSTSLRVTCSRTAVRSRAGRDYLCIIAIVKRGAGSTLVLHNARARVTYVQGQGLPDLRTIPEAKWVPAVAESETDLIAAVRLSSGTAPGKVLKIKFDQVSSEAPLLNLAPSDEMQFAAVYEVDQSLPCVVEVTILGKSWATWKRSQWRASDISLPISPEQ